MMLIPEMRLLVNLIADHYSRSKQSSSVLKEGVIPSITPRQWLNYVRKSDLDFGASDLLDHWGDGEGTLAETLENVSSDLDNAVDCFEDLFAGGASVTAYRGLPLGWRGKLVRADGTISNYEDDYDPNWEFEAWLKTPFNPLTGGVGMSWTWNERAAINFDQGRGPTNIVLKAEIPASSVDWLYSFSILVNDQSEQELRLKPQSKLRLLSARRFDFDSGSYIGEWIDLKNKAVRA